MRLSTFTLLAALTFFAGCANIEPVGKGAIAGTQQIRDKNYIIGVERVATVGDTFIKSRQYSLLTREADAVEVPEAVTVKCGFIYLRLYKGEKLPIVGQRVIEGVTYAIAKKKSFGLMIGPDGKLRPRLINGLGVRGTFPVDMIYAMSTTPPNITFQPGRRQTVDASTFIENYEIVFDGIDGQAMHFQYREYTAENLARPAFAQDLSYPLNTRTIRFRKLVVDVREVTAEHIRYSVMSDS
jgi:hypothetical protein